MLFGLAIIILYYKVIKNILINQQPILNFYLSNLSKMFKFRQKLINCYLTKNNNNKHSISINYLDFFFISKINN